MDERTLREEALEGVNGGVGGLGHVRFPDLAEDFARASRCSACPNRDLKAHHGICMEGYMELLNDFTRGGPMQMRCRRRP